MDTHVLELIKPKKLKSPVLIEGLPGIGLVGKLAVDHLIDVMGGKLIAELYSPYFPHHVMMQEDGIVTMVKYDFYLVKGSEHDLIILSGDVQPSAGGPQYELNSIILDYFKNKLKGDLVITLGGYGSGKAVKKTTVYGAANNAKMIKKYSKLLTFGKSPGPIIGAAGLLLGIGQLKKIDGVCVMGETHGGYVDPKAAKALIKVLSKMLGFKVSVSALDKKAKESEVLFKKFEEMSAQEQKAKDSSDATDLSYIR